MSERALGLVVLLVFGRWGRSTGRRGRLGAGLLIDEMLNTFAVIGPHDVVAGRI